MTEQPGSGPPAALAVRGLGIAFGPVQVCTGIDLELPAGSLGSLIGTNGAGKSTILRALAGVIPAQGSIRLFGEEISGLSPRQRVRRGLMLAAGGRGAFGSLTVEESLAVGVHSTEWAKGAATAVEGALALFPRLASRRTQRTGTLSAGEQHLVTLARAIIARPRVLLVDELSLGLSGAMADDVGQVLAARGDVLLVDQSISRALALASWAWFLERGAVRYSGPARDLAGRHDLLAPVLPA